MALSATKVARGLSSHQGYAPCHQAVAGRTIRRHNAVVLRGCTKLMCFSFENAAIAVVSAAAGALMKSAVDYYISRDEKVAKVRHSIDTETAIALKNMNARIDALNVCMGNNFKELKADLRVRGR